jgi:hypothetical protein
MLITSLRLAPRRGNASVFRTHVGRLAHRLAAVDAASEARDELAADAWARLVERRQARRLAAFAGD